LTYLYPMPTFCVGNCMPGHLGSKETWRHAKVGSPGRAWSEEGASQVSEHQIQDFQGSPKRGISEKSRHNEQEASKRRGKSESSHFHKSLAWPSEAMTVTPRFPNQRNNANINIRVSTTTEYYIYFSKFI